ncbi:uncharacterized protein BDZ99DRAFT_524589 [Mytilinidion resinicola]|uniref:Uncharacterized protein n=1 Tax=Mytilinidion resinicola TaxID=574789 RepID=A0A6A6YAI3_9PEZI|nr:uncharacterized protein BDZ99DRAFT_524589 [Mytilinidion resinicola]KAF2805629.1 hypothetical protein BDZ99DRAFT_524589 [Mytilinidion resinicola]
MSSRPVLRIHTVLLTSAGSQGLLTGTCPVLLRAPGWTLGSGSCRGWWYRGLAFGGTEVHYPIFQWQYNPGKEGVSNYANSREDELWRIQYRSPQKGESHDDRQREFWMPEYEWDALRTLIERDGVMSDPQEQGMLLLDNGWHIWDGNEGVLVE